MDIQAIISLVIASKAVPISGKWVSHVQQRKPPLIFILGCRGKQDLNPPILDQVQLTHSSSLGHFPCSFLSDSSWQGSCWELLMRELEAPCKYPPSLLRQAQALCLLLGNLTRSWMDNYTPALTPSYRRCQSVCAFTCVMRMGWRSPLTGDGCFLCAEQHATLS